MFYVNNLKNNNKQQKSEIMNKAFKYVLFGITLFVVFLIIMAFAVVIMDGIGSVSDNETYSWTDILFGTEFSMPGSMAMGIIIINTVWMSILVLIVATPISVATALFITKIASPRVRNLMVSVVAILAAIPSVIYGAFGKYVILNVVYNLGYSDLSTTATLMSVIIIVSLMVIPTITLMSTTSLMMVDKKMEDSSEALGATRVQTSIFVSLRSAKTGIIIGMLFALGRCLGEATAISMLSGESFTQIGFNLKLSEVSLFMSPVIMQAFNKSQDGIEWAAFVYSVLSALLLITIILIFSFVKFIEHNTDDLVKSKKQSKRAIQLNNIDRKINEGKFDSLSKNDISLYEKNLIHINDEHYRMESAVSIRKHEIDHINSRTSLLGDAKGEAFKEGRTIIYKAIIIALSMVGVIALISILGFLFNTDLSLLFNWEYLSSTGPIFSEAMGDGAYIGLGMAMFGTMFNIIVSLAIALPLGILIAIFLNTYLKGEGWLSSGISFSFQIMTSIPAVIYGTLASIIFVQGGFIRENANSLVPVIMLSLVILPTIIKQTTEGFNNVKNSQVEGSQALGASDAYTSIRIVLKQSMPAILSAAILAISIVMADSAIMITIIGKPGTPSLESDWIEQGGYTLATLIYYLSSTADPATRFVAIEQIKVIGIILMLLIFWLTMISQKIKSNNNLSALIMFVGIIVYMTSYWIFGGVLILMIAGLALGLIGAFIDLFIERK